MWRGGERVGVNRSAGDSEDKGSEVVSLERKSEREELIEKDANRPQVRGLAVRR